MDNPTLFDEFDDDDEFAFTHTRRDDPDTSREAAAKLTSLHSHCRRLLETFHHQSQSPGWFGLTAEEAAEESGIDPWAASKRISDLRHMKFITWIIVNGTPLTRRGSSTRKQRVYDITSQGRDALSGKLF